MTTFKGFGDATKSMGFSAPCVWVRQNPQVCKIPDFATSIILDESIGTPPPGNSLLWPHEHTYDMGGLSKVVVLQLDPEGCESIHFCTMMQWCRVYHCHHYTANHTNIYTLRIKWNLQTRGSDITDICKAGFFWISKARFESSGCLGYNVYMLLPKNWFTVGSIYSMTLYFFKGPKGTTCDSNPRMMDGLGDHPFPRTHLDS